MLYVFNLVIIGLVLLVAYWWANQGLFSALLHLLCVIAAGAIALAIWEPLVTGLLLRGTFFDNYAWGVGLVVPFALILLVLRVIFDKAVGGNVDLPRWANLVFGGAAGFAAGVITIGLVVIGCGFVQSAPEIMGFTGFVRSKDRGSTIAEADHMWLPVHTLTYEFYSMLSAGALYPDFNNTPLNRVYPQLDRVAVSLHRDSFSKGKGKTSLLPAHAVVQRVLACEECNPKRIAVEVLFKAGARDYGEVLTLSSAQIRLIGAPSANASKFVEAKVAYPMEFTQHSGHHRFDDTSHYISSKAAQQESLASVEFYTSDLSPQEPRYIQVRGTRFRLPRPGSAQWLALSPDDYARELKSVSSVGLSEGVQLSESGTDITVAIKVGNDIRPVSLSVNRMPSGLEYVKVNDKNYLSDGDGEIVTSGDRPGRGLGIEGIIEPKGARVVQLDVSRSSNASLNRDDLAALVGPVPTIQLVDTQGSGYPPIGYILTLPTGRTRIKLDTQNYLRTRNDLPELPTSDTNKLKLLFHVTEGVTISGLKLGEVTIGRCSVNVGAAGQPQQQPAGDGTGIGG